MLALRTLNPSISWRPKSDSSPDDRALLLQLPPRRSDRRTPGCRGARASDVGNGGLGAVPPIGGKGSRRMVTKDADLATLGNLCVDIVLNVPSLPPAPPDERKAYMEKLAASPPDKKFWEAGGNCNLAIAAARLGLHCVTLGHVGQEIYGNFLLQVLRDEGICSVGMLEKMDTAMFDYAYETLLCWVLVDPYQRHGFCSRADFSKEPAFHWIRELSPQVRVAIQQSKILFCNGYAFDEFFPDVIVSALHCAIDAGTAIFFDPGPRGRTLIHGTSEQRRALELFLQLSDVLLLTLDEAESLTGSTNPIRAGKELLRRGAHTKWVVIKMGSKGSIMITKSTVSCAPAFKVDVVDTVGCGDSFTAAVAFGFLRGMPTIHTLALANAVGAATATGCGAGRNVASLDKVLELLKQSDLNEDDSMLNSLMGANSLESEVSVLSQSSINGYGDGLVRIPARCVVSELLPIFVAACERSMM